MNLRGVTSSEFDSGNPFKSTHLVCFDGKLIQYGNSAITYTNPPAAAASAGKLLFDQTCSSCHGSEANGVSPDGQATIGPNLQGVGAATVDFWITTGRMPATDIAAVEAERKPPVLSDAQALEVAAYINSLDPSVPAVPNPHLRGANVADRRLPLLPELRGLPHHHRRRGRPGLRHQCALSAEQEGHGPAGGRGHTDRAGQHAPVLGQPHRCPGP